MDKKLRSQCDQGNAFVHLTLEGCTAAHDAGAWWLIEHPEDLGRTKTGDDPASIWQLPEVRNLAASCGAHCFAVHQCHFGAGTSKPTRFATTLPATATVGHPGWPDLDDNNKYRGPLPAGCGHRHSSHLIGRKEDGSFLTAASATYPPDLCKFLAELIVHSVLGGQAGQAPAPRSAGSSTQAQGRPPTIQHWADAPTSDEDFDGEPRAKTRPGGSGPPLSVTVAGKDKPFTDGAGLCSPGRWHPDKRLVQPPLAARLRELLYKAIDAATPDPQRLVFELATGKRSASPWPEEVVEKLLFEWHHLLPPGQGAPLFRKSYQPFYLSLIGQTLKELGDPDWKIFEKDPKGFSEGVPVGFREKLPRTPAVFERKTRWRAYDEVAEVSLCMDNYRSTAGLEAVLEAQFQEESLLGMMFRCSMNEARRLWPGDRLRIAAQGAIEKGDSTWRVVHDGTHGVAVNHEIRPRDQLSVPTVGELRGILELASTEKPGVHFSLQADVKKAHRRVLHQEADWGLLACRSDSRSDQVWINRCGCFGIGSAAYWWARLAAGIGRLALATLGREFAWQLIFVDDLLWTAWGPNKYYVLLSLVLLWEAVGTPFSWHKTRGGLEQDWVGYWFDAGRFQVGISARRAAWLADWARQITRDNLVLMRRFAEGLGRLGFAAGVLEWARPFLGPLYAWSAAAPLGAALPPPESVRLVLAWLADQLGQGRRHITCSRPHVDLGELFRTDAKGERGRLVIGGWKCQGGAPPGASPWFSLAITEADAPWAFRDGEASRTIAAGELLATLVAVRLFAPADGSGRASYTLSGTTDNLGNCYVIKRLMTTKRPLGPLVMQLASDLYERQLWLSLRWTPRERNAEADALTNEDFARFDPGLRVPLKWEDVRLPVAQKLFDTEAAFAAALTEARAQKAEIVAAATTTRRRKTTKEEW